MHTKVSAWTFTLSLLSLLGCSLSPAHAALYQVGPSQPYSSLGAVPWTKLAPGDTVNIYWQAQPYREKVLLSCRGTAAQPISVVGIPGPNGQLPVIDGQNATTSNQFQFNYAGTQDRGLMVLSLDKQHSWGYKPGYIVLQGLEFRNAAKPNTFTDGQGLPRAFTRNAAAIFVERGEHIIVRGCTIDGSGNGFFVASGGSEELISRDILLEKSYVYGNGNNGSDREHNIYTEAIGTVFQYNHLGHLRQGSLGSNLKDRSSGTVVRYNWIENGGHLLDLVEPQDSAPILTLDPNFHRTYVYGNVMINDPNGSSSMIHYGGDQYIFPNYRKGTLYCYNNTVVNFADQTGSNSRWRTVLLSMDTNDEVTDLRNNVLYNCAATPGKKATDFSLMNQAGTLSCNDNWISPDWFMARTGTSFIGTVTGTDTMISNLANIPGFANLSTLDISLAAASSCVGAGMAYLPQEQGPFGVYYQYQSPQSSMLRYGNAKGPDLGALGFGSPIPAPAFKISGQVMCKNQVLAGAMISADNGNPILTAADGTYTLTGMSPDVHTISAVKPGYLLSASQSVTLIGNQAGVNFTASAVYKISGHVTCQGQGLAGATVSVGNGNTTLTAADGTYTLSSLLPTVYTISATKNGYSMDAAQILKLDGNKSAINFIAVSNAAPAQLIALTLNNSQVNSFGSVQATVTVNKPVPGINTLIKMTSSNPAIVRVSDLTLWNGQISRSFPITTASVMQPTIVTITATCDGVTKTVLLTVLP